MTDRELLEFAAKAAGMNAHEAMWHPRAGFVWVKRVDGIRTENAWNPLADDGDALRLAVKLRLCLDTYMDPSSRFNTDERCTLVVLPSPSDYSAGEWHADSDPYAATRRAIVRAAAELGKAKP